VIATKPQPALQFYRDKLGFNFPGDHGFALVFNARGTRMRLPRERTKNVGETPALQPLRAVGEDHFAALAGEDVDLALVDVGESLFREEVFGEEEDAVRAVPEAFE
jgi:catechol 2,3-dioxygenase-like lactoylglutathione lyase family enzyme